MAIILMPKRYLLLLSLLIFFKLTDCKKLTSRDVNQSRKLDDCKRCKLLTDSFNCGFDKTSRGKYEGGDAAWEESKLKSYARSEIRLVEIQEGLCSELESHQDACYAIAEEAEQVLEQWWFNKEPTSVDLYTWLCIETLQHCCPVKHFGDACSPCLQDKNNKVCGGHGKCDGAGTRKGNGTCICNKGYIGKLCDECDKNFYLTTSGSCATCHKSCNGCSDEGAAACESCNTGWHTQSGVCVDIDECTSSVCKPNEYCINTAGSYSCKECELVCKTCKGEGLSNCTSCESNVLWFGMCIDQELKNNIIINTYKRLALYIGLLLITLFISHTSKLVATIVIIVTSIFIYYSENSLKTNTIDVLLQM